MVQALSNYDVMPNYSQATLKLLSEVHRMEIRNKQLGVGKALVVNLIKMHVR